MGRRFPSPHTVGISLDNSGAATGNYTCELDTEGPCGGTVGVLNLAIYGKPNALCIVEDKKTSWADDPSSLGKQHKHLSARLIILHCIAYYILDTCARQTLCAYVFVVTC